MGSGAQATATPHQERTAAACTALASPHPDDTLLIVGGYTDIDLLAHTPCVASRFDAPRARRWTPACTCCACAVRTES